ncbi:alpha/beta hydrolase family esterase [Pseudooctadecabacter jejudonensis]|uniref:Alpha/beta hydrolase family protein n=1 Tax=Pseudooctadecabacter jejudonensis TaxID=1391910 RepID=A0A1Y5SNB7_9RHOB|nr:alpha/beta fold hydrolase [Pseudooctadecabacter jejudonensis]SLN44084.1 Alpha/beta hydrolase family protein [Pseudooctadecabacter jejudonensis]
MRWLALVWAAALATPAWGCTPEAQCEIGGRAYVAALPQTAQTPPAVIYLHGFGGSGQGVLRNQRIVDAFLARGFAIIAPDGQPRAEGNGRRWDFHPRSPDAQQAEVDHLIAVRDDAVARLGLDPDNIILAGFSIGGSMTAYTACLSPDAFAAYAPLGGNFWRPHPQGCAGPVRMLHTHGWVDGTVPLEGRVVNGLPSDDPAAFSQGDVFEALSIWRDANGCLHEKPDRFDVSGEYWMRTWTECAAGSALQFALFPRGHIVPVTWPDLVVDWYEGL